MRSGKVALLFFLFCAVILSRNILETAFLSRHYFLSGPTLVHHFSWYLFTATWYAVVLRFVAGASLAVLPRFLPGAFILYIPLVYSLASGMKLQLDYLYVTSIGYAARHVATLFYFHPQNRPFFGELLFLALGLTVAGYFFSRSIVRTLLVLIIGFYGSFLLCGLYLFGAPQSTYAVWRLPTLLNEQVLLGLLFSFFSALAGVLLIFPEVARIVRRERRLLSFVLLCVLAVGVSALLSPRCSSFDAVLFMSCTGISALIGSLSRFFEKGYRAIAALYALLPLAGIYAAIFAG